MSSVDARHERLMRSGKACHVVRDYIAHFANPLRLRILCALSAGEAGVSELVSITEARQPAVSQQLNLLRLSGVVSRRRDGNRSEYQLADPIAEELMQAIFTVAEKLIAREETELEAGAC